MTKQQKIIIALLSVVAVVVLAGLGCAAVYLLILSPAPGPAPTTAAVVQQSSSTPLPVPSSTPIPAATTAPTETPPPTPTATQVVVETVLPMPTPTRANCIDDITNFGDSGVITDEQVQQYLRDTIPLSHLDHCRGIEYVARRGAVHTTPIAGNIIPVYREIYVYAIDPEVQGVENLLDTLIHEIGHNVNYNIRRDNFDLDVQWAELHKQSKKTFTDAGLGFVSDYARTDKFEDFAESYLAYIHYPDILEFANVDKYEFMRQEIFKGRQYPR